MKNIVIEKTFEKFGYDPKDLKPNSAKLVIWKCSECGIEKDKKMQLAIKNKLCLNCSNKKNANTNKDQKIKKLKEWYKNNKHPLEGKKRPKDVCEKISKTRLEKKFKHSDETKEKLSILNSGEGNPMYGKSHTEKTIEKIRKNSKKTTRKGKKSNFYKNKYSLNKRYTLEQIRVLSKRKHNNMYDIPEQEYTDTKTIIKIYCNNCSNYFYQVTSYHINGCGCNICNLSKGELEIKTYLDNKKIEYIKQYKFDGCKNIKPLPFDFYLPEYNICIEFDGEQHFEINEYFGGKNGLKNRQKNDKIKTNFCQNNDIKLIRIRNIENIIKKLDNGIQ